MSAVYWECPDCYANHPPCEQTCTTTRPRDLVRCETCGVRFRSVVAPVLGHCVDEQKAPAEDEIRATCAALADMLVEKNRAYGDSALSPRRIVSTASPSAGILIRIDDKLSWIQNGDGNESEDVWRDLAGYVVLFLIARERERAGG